MISLVPIVMIAGFGYVIYRWMLSSGTHQIARRGANKSDTRVNTSTRTSDSGEERKKDTAAAATAAVHW